MYTLKQVYSHFKIAISSQNYPGASENYPRHIIFTRKKVLKLYINTLATEVHSGTFMKIRVLSYFVKF